MTDHDEPGQLDTEAYVAEVNQLRELIDSERQLRRSAEKAADKQARAVRILRRELSAERNARMDTSRLHECEDQLDLRSAELSESRRGTVVMIIGAVILGALCALLVWWGVSMSERLISYSRSKPRNGATLMSDDPCYWCPFAACERCCDRKAGDDA